MNKIVILLGLLGFIVMADNWVVSPILPAISENLGVRGFVSDCASRSWIYLCPFCPAGPGHRICGHSPWRGHEPETILFFSYHLVRKGKNIDKGLMQEYIINSEYIDRRDMAMKELIG